MSLKDLSDSLGLDRHNSIRQMKPKEFEMDAQIKVIPSYKMMAVQFPDEFVDDINNHIDNVIIPSQKSHGGYLVGQINQDEKSAQWTFPLDSEIGKNFKSVVDKCANSLLREKNGYARDSIAEAFEAWSVHSYSGDYNPLHAHGLITSTNTINDIYRLKLDAQEYIKPKKGFMMIFPNWLQHCVMPFFGEGERRTMSANFNIRDSKKTVEEFTSPTLTKEI